MVSFVTCFFFFQAEDGIRDVAVTGVQTCALPIYLSGGGQNEEAIYSGSIDIGNGTGGTAYGRARRAGAGHRKRIVARHYCGQKNRKSTRLKSSHGYNSYAVFFFKKKKKK